MIILSPLCAFMSGEEPLKEVFLNESKNYLREIYKITRF